MNMILTVLFTFAKKCYYPALSAANVAHTSVICIATMLEIVIIGH